MIEEAGEDERDVDNVVEEPLENLDQSWWELGHLRFAQMNLNFLIKF